MAHMFAEVIGGQARLGLWYHFAIMFEALFILTTLDAGTRVGRFILQDLLGQAIAQAHGHRLMDRQRHRHRPARRRMGAFPLSGVRGSAGIVKPSGRSSASPTSCSPSIAFCFGTTLLIKMNKARYCLVTVVPLVFLTAVTFTAGWLKLFSASAGGFLPEIDKQQALLAKGLQGQALEAAKTSLFNARIDVAVTATFLIFISIIVLGTARECWLLLRKRKENILRESPYVSLPEPG